MARIGCPMLGKGNETCYPGCPDLVAGHCKNLKYPPKLKYRPKKPSLLLSFILFIVGALGIALAYRMILDGNLWGIPVGVMVGLIFYRLVRMGG
jgi:hypothetical protein